MKAAFDKFLENDGGGMEEGDEGLDMESVGTMFEEGDASDPLMDALMSAGFEVDEEKASRIRAILEETPEDMGGEGLEEEGAGVMPSGMGAL